MPPPISIDPMLIERLGPELAETITVCRDSTKAFASVFMKDRFSREFDAPHDQIFDVIDDPRKRHVAIVAPRGIGKTSILAGPFLARHICFGLTPYIVYVSKAEKHAVNQTENLKWSLQTNNYLKAFFGDIRSDDFSKEQWVTANGVCVLPRGSGQQIRGLNFRGSRPGLIIIDDLEDSELVLNEEYRAKQWEWFNSDLLNSVDLSSGNFKIVIIGTLLHEQSLLARLDPEFHSGMEQSAELTAILADGQGSADDIRWHYMNLPICDDGYEALWPNYLPKSKVLALRRYYAQRHALDVFAREFRGLPTAREGAKFDISMFKPYSEETLAADAPTLENVVLVDPGKTVTASADPTAIVGVGIDSVRNRLYVREAISRRLTPNEIYEETFRMLQRLGARTLGYEVTSLNEFIIQPLKSFLHSKSAIVELVELKARGKKLQRIAALEPYYRMGAVFHNANGCCRGLEDQLLSYPRARHDDLMDAFAYVVELMELGGRYFHPNATTAPDASEQAAYDRLLAEDREAEVLPYAMWAP